MFSESYNSYVHNLCNSHLSTNCSARVTIPTKRVQLVSHAHDWPLSLPELSASISSPRRFQFHHDEIGTKHLHSASMLYYGELCTKKDSKTMQLQERVITQINEAERLSAMIDQLKEPETALIAFGLLPDWNEAAKQAVHLCRLAIVTLSTDELNQLIDRVNALGDEEASLWEHYATAEWYDGGPTLL